MRPSSTEEADVKEARLEHPSGFLYLTRTEGVPLLIDALLDLPPGREFNQTELARHAGVSRHTVANHLETLLDVDVVEPVSGTSPQRYRLADSEVVEELLGFNGALNAARD